MDIDLHKVKAISVKADTAIANRNYAVVTLTILRDGAETVEITLYGAGDSGQIQLLLGEPS